MKKVMMLISVVLVIVSCVVHAAPLQDEHAAVALATSAMDTLVQKGVRGAFETISPHWNKTKVELESVISKSEKTREQWSRTYGKYVGYEKIAEKKVGESLFMVTLLEKTEKRGVVWYFTFYKPKDTWIISSCYWDPNFEALLLLKQASS
jgi:hypothetical protein